MAFIRDTYILVFGVLSAHYVLGHIPERYYDWAEPDAPVHYVNNADNLLSKALTESRLQALRQILSEEGLGAYIIPTADAHNSQYIAPTDARLEWISSFTGSAGTVVVTPDFALLWTDSRYFTQFDMEVNAEHWILMRPGVDLAMPNWLTANLTSGTVVGIDPTTYTRSLWTNLMAFLTRDGIELRAVPENLVDKARWAVNDPPPSRPNQPLLALTTDYTGKRSSEKISELMDQITSRGANALVLTALDDIAYTLNIRGSDIPFNPVFFAYLVIRVDVESPNNIILFWGDGTPAANIVEHLNSEGSIVDFRPYENIFEYIRTLSATPSVHTIWLSQDGSHAIHLAAETDNTVSILSTLSPVSLMKCVKNEVELQGFRTSHIKDGTAVVRFLRWIHEQVDNEINVTEMDVSIKLDELRSDEEDYMGPSFATIAGAGENGAVIHYRPSDENPRVVNKDDMLLVDSGGQYKDGTTDITRTRHMSQSPTDEQRNAFTRVLKGQILLGTAVFPRGITGNVLETFARKALWDVGLNYAHGTGHGVGHFLNVHEGPSGILSSVIANDPGIVPGMIFSDEPGYYEVGHYGIRHEDLVEVIEVNRNADHPRAAGMVGDFLGIGAIGFKMLSLAPHQTSSLDIELLDDFEIQFINDYHTRVLETIGPILQQRNLTDDYEWLRHECEPIHRSNAILYTATPIVLVISLINMCF